MSSPEERVLAYMDSWNRHAAHECGAFFAEHGVREWRILSRVAAPGERFPRFTGPEAIATAIGAFMHAIPDLRVEVLRASALSDHQALVEWVVRGTHENDWGPWIAQGEQIDFPGVSLYRIAGDHFTEERMYWDPAVMMTVAA